MKRQVFHMVRTKIILLFVVVVAILTTAFFYVSNRSKNIIYEKVTENNQNLLDFYGQIMEEKFNSAEAFLVSQRLHPSLYLGIEHAGQSKENYFASYDIHDFFMNSSFGENSFDYIFAYAPESDTYVDYGYSFTNEKEAIFEKTIQHGITEGKLQVEKWEIFQIEEEYLAYYMIVVYDVYIGCVIEMQNLKDQFVQKSTMEEGLLFFDVKGVPFQKDYENSSVLLQDVKSEYGRTIVINGKKYLENTIVICDGMLTLLYYVDQEYLSRQLVETNRIVLIFILILSVITIAGIWILWKSLITPLSNLVQGVNELKRGNFQYQLKECKNGEFKELTTAFRDMSQEIWKLKIDIYEEQIQRQKAQLMFLQSQLKPHFLSNCLNNLRALELAGEHEKFQDLITKVGSYMRATLSSRGTSTLEEELQNTCNYVDIQRVRYENRFDTEIVVCKDLLQMNVPVQILQCFVENAIKYQLDSESQLHIAITVDFADDACESMKIMITDNGKGFESEVLDLLNAGKQVKKENRACIGIYNVMSRLKIYYHDRAEIHFYNQVDLGATIEILLPIE